MLYWAVCRVLSHHLCTSGTVEQERARGRRRKRYTERAKEAERCGGSKRYRERGRKVGKTNTRSAIASSITWSLSSMDNASLESAADRRITKIPTDLAYDNHTMDYPRLPGFGRASRIGLPVKDSAGLGFDSRSTCQIMSCLAYRLGRDQ